MRALKIAVATLWTVAGAAGYAASDNVKVVVFNYGAVPRRVLVSAAKEARSAFLAAGIETEWILCGRQDCLVPPEAVQVTILRRPSKEAPVSPNGMAYTRLCSGAVSCAQSYVFYDRVEELAQVSVPPVEVALGYVVAHEVGHLLGLGHSASGIMKAGFTSHDLLAAAIGSLRFPKDEATRLRAAVGLSTMARIRIGLALAE